jgi:hypothetical protein
VLTLEFENQALRPANAFKRISLSMVACSEEIHFMLKKKKEKERKQEAFN